MRAWCWLFYRFPGFSPLSLCLVCSLRTMFSDSDASDWIKMRCGDFPPYQHRNECTSFLSAGNRRPEVGDEFTTRWSRHDKTAGSTDARNPCHPHSRPLNRASQVHCRISHVHNNTLPWTSSFSHSCVEIMQSSIPRISRERRKFTRDSRLFNLCLRLLTPFAVDRLSAELSLHSGWASAVSSTSSWVRLAANEWKPEIGLHTIRIALLKVQFFALTHNWRTYRSGERVFAISPALQS